MFFCHHLSIDHCEHFFSLKVTRYVPIKISFRRNMLAGTAELEIEDLQIGFDSFLYKEANLQL